jgi:hypothetical protein
MHLPNARDNGGIVMVGVVSTRHLLICSAVILREFGVFCLLRCVWRTLTTNRPVTFLECAIAFERIAP